MTRSYDPAAIASSAIENAGRIPVTAGRHKADALYRRRRAISHYGLFSDVNYAALLRLAIAFDISDDDLARAHVRARDTMRRPMPTSTRL